MAQIGAHALHRSWPAVCILSPGGCDRVREVFQSQPGSAAGDPGQFWADAKPISADQCNRGFGAVHAIHLVHDA